MPTPAISIADARVSDVLNEEHTQHYVSARDDLRYFLIAGPYGSHEEAAAKVNEVRLRATDIDAKAHWMAWGASSSCEIHDTPLGVL